MSKDAFIIARVDVADKRRLEAEAKKLGVSVSSLLRKIIKENVGS